MWGKKSLQANKWAKSSNDGSFTWFLRILQTLPIWKAKSCTQLQCQNFVSSSSAWCPRWVRGTHKGKDAALGPAHSSMCATSLPPALWPAASPKTYGHLLDCKLPWFLKISSPIDPIGVFRIDFPWNCGGSASVTAEMSAVHQEHFWASKNTCRLALVYSFLLVWALKTHSSSLLKSYK